MEAAGSEAEEQNLGAQHECAPFEPGKGAGVKESLSHSVSFAYWGCELWFSALLSLLSSLTMKNSVCSGDGGGADSQNDTGKEGKSSQLSGVTQERKKLCVIEHKRRICWSGLAELEESGIKSPLKHNSV